MLGTLSDATNNNLGDKAGGDMELKLFLRGTLAFDAVLVDVSLLGVSTMGGKMSFAAAAAAVVDAVVVDASELPSLAFSPMGGNF